MEGGQVDELEERLDNSYNNIVRALLKAPADSPGGYTLRAETYTTFCRIVASSIISKGPNNGIAGADTRIISNGNPETQDRRNDGDNDDTQSNGRGVTNGYAFDSDID